MRETLDRRCSALIIPDASLVGVDSFSFPEQWPLADATTQDGTCDNFDRAPDRPAIGALGTLTRDPNCYPAFDADFTLFFHTADGDVEGVRFKGKFVPSTNGGPACP